jgi:hypothetical protein
MPRNLLAIAALLVLSGCATTDLFVNRLSCSLDEKQGYINSMYGRIGITSEVDPRDAKIMCKKGQ